MVKDNTGQSISNTQVIFQGPPTGPGIAGGFFTGSSTISATSQTDATGIATAPLFSANVVAGSYQITVTAQGVITPTSIFLTNLASNTSLPPAESVAYQLNTLHNGALSSGTRTLPRHIKWTANFSNNTSYPLIAEGRVFVLTGSSVVAVEANSGQLIWTAPAPGAFGIAYDRGKLFTITGSGLLSGYDGANGLLLWSGPLPSEYSFSSIPTALNGMVYTGGSGDGGYLYGVRESDGALLWLKDVWNGDSSSPVVTNDGVFVSYVCPQVYKFQPLTGNLLWWYKPNCEGGGGSTPIYYNGNLYVQDGLGSTNFIFDAASGNVVSNFPAPFPLTFAGGLGFLLTGSGMEARDAITQQVVWSVNSPTGSFATQPIILNDRVYLTTSAGDIYAYKVADGIQVWHANFGAAPVNNLALSDDLLVIPVANGLIAYSFDPGYTSSPEPGQLIDFGLVEVHTIVTTSLTITQTGSAPLVVSNPVITGTGAADFTIDPAAFPLTVTTNGLSQTVPISCTPSLAQLRLAQLTLTTNDPDNPSVSYNLSCAGALIVTKNSDDGSGTISGTLSFLLKQPDISSQTIGFRLDGGGNVISVTGQLPLVPTSIVISGTCTANGPGIVLDGATTPAGTVGLLLGGQDNLFGLEVKNFGGVQIKSSGYGNKLSCIRAYSRNAT